MRLNEFFGFGKKLQTELDRQDITPEERSMVMSVFSDGHNADLKMGDGSYVLPGNITLIYKSVRINFYKDGDQLHADIGWYGEGKDPSSPKTSPLTSTDEKINDRNDLVKLKKSIDF